jgi:N-acetylmuramoyl-L-alanine amidase
MSGLGQGGKILIVGLFLATIALGIVTVNWLMPEPPKPDPTPTTVASESTPVVVEPSPTPLATEPPSPTPLPEPSQTPVPTPGPFRIGIVAGHWQSDSGAVCPDGLQEVSINLDVASSVVAILQSEMGYQAELMPEFSDRLQGYKADVFVSIHTDACNVEASGFKVARVDASAIPEEEDRLVACIIREYGEVTGLAFHANSITFDMTVYHAFNEIDPQTPGAIIELGFMGADREILTEGAYDLARGVAQGIVCFLEGE